MDANSNSNSPTYRYWNWLIAPALAAIYPVIYTFASSIPDVNLRDALVCGAVIVLASFALTASLCFAFAGAKRAGLAAVLVIVWCFTYSGYMRIGRMAIDSVSSSPLKDYVLMCLWVAV